MASAKDSPSTTPSKPNISVTEASSPEDQSTPAGQDLASRGGAGDGQSRASCPTRPQNDSNMTQQAVDSHGARTKSGEGDGVRGSPGTVSASPGTITIGTNLRGRRSTDSLGATSQGSTGDGDTSSLASGSSSPSGASSSSGKLEVKLGKIEVIRGTTEEELLAKMEEQNRYHIFEEIYLHV